MKKIFRSSKKSNHLKVNPVKLEKLNSVNQNSVESLHSNIPYPKTFPKNTYKFVYVKVEDKPIEKVTFDDPLNIFEKITPNLKIEDIDNKPVVIFSKEQATYKFKNENPLFCAYDATNLFISSWLGRKLNEADRKWYSRYPKINQNGLPEQYTLSILHELVLPYEIGISKVIVSPGTYIHQDNRVFQDALGINPIALVDRSTNNDDYLKIISGGDQEVLNSLADEVYNSFRFEYSSLLPQGPFVVFAEQGKTPGGGHASYISPRDNPPPFKLAIQFDFLKNITYKASIPSANYSPDDIKKVLDFWNCKDINGKILSSYKFPSVSISKHGLVSNFKNFS